MTRKHLRAALDIALGVGLATVAIAELWVPLDSIQGSGSRELSTVVAVILCLALIGRRRWPVVTALVVLLTWPAAFLIHPVYVLFWGQLIPIAVATYSVARYSSKRGATVGAIAAAACMLFFDLRVPGMNDVGEIVFHWMVAVVAFATGTVLRLAERRAAASTQLAIETELASRTRTVEAIAEERARISRELHDIVAHAVSMMVVQAGAAEQVVDDDPDFTRNALGSIRKTGADALTEMRRVVTMLRDDVVHDDLHPQPGVGALPVLVAASSTDLLAISLDVTGAERPLPAGLNLTAYRIVQEALTNVRRHSGARSAAVTVAYDSSALHLTIADDGTGVGGGELVPGNGVIGMRERVALYGGTLVLGVGAGGDAGSASPGFAVRATLPLESA